jgi:hypothetical protein
MFYETESVDIYELECKVRFHSKITGQMLSKSKISQI